jgi:hypothetical protein
MPFGVKKTEIAKEGVPVEIDFDRLLWDVVYRPVLPDAGYHPVRADRDMGAVIVLEMIQRLALSDLVVADVTLPNANVYYEVGVRHAAKRTGCVLVAAEWAEPVFDLRQIRQLRFPLRDGGVGDEAAVAARAALQPIDDLGAGQSPAWEAVPGFPDNPDLSKISAFEDMVAELSEFDTDVRAARLVGSSQRRAKALEVFEKHGQRKIVRESVVLQLIRLLRDEVGWDRVLEYIATLPGKVARHPLVVGQRCLALGETGDPAGAAAELQSLISREGASPERLGLLGGRFKDLYRTTTSPADRRRYLSNAIESYEGGIERDLNEYYCASNLPRLYRVRGQEGDQRLAFEAELVALQACRRAVKLGTADEWARPTLLGLAFDRGDVIEAERLQAEIERDGADAWKLHSMLDDLEAAVAAKPDGSVKTQLEVLLKRLWLLVPPVESADPAPSSTSGS